MTYGLFTYFHIRQNLILEISILNFPKIPISTVSCRYIRTHYEKECRRNKSDQRTSLTAAIFVKMCGSFNSLCMYCICVELLKI